MKTIYLILFCTILQLYASAQCIPSVSNGGATGDYIASVTFSTLSNLNTNDNVCDYASYTPSTTVTPGLAYSFNIATGSSTLAQKVAIWIDYNHNQNFTDVGEDVFVSTSTITSSNPASGVVSIPMTSTLGRTRMRIACQRAGTSAALLSCNNLSYGEYEDYDIIIMGAGCGTKPFIGALQVLCCSNASTNNFLLYSQQINVNAYYNYQWFCRANCIGPWFAIFGTGNASVMQAPTGSTFGYMCRVTCPITGIADTSNIICGPCGAALPIQLSLFKATLADNDVLMHWTMSFEQEIAYYLVERSEDAINFTSISAAIFSQQQLSYSYIDKNVAAGNHYYRIKMVDVNGNFMYSNIAHIIKEHNEFVTIQPNPCTDKLAITIFADEQNFAEIICVDMMGRTVFAEVKHLQKGNNLVNVYTTNWGAGLYLIRINSNDEIVQRKILKQ